MTSADSNAPARVSSGVTHIRARQTAHFTILANRLAQRAGSAVTVGVAAYILSLPDGAPISIQALCTHFAEGKVVISAALRELEAEGWLERRVERGPRGRVVTRTFVYDLPGAMPDDQPGAVPQPGPEPVAEPEPHQELAPSHRRRPRPRPPTSWPVSTTATAASSSPSGRSPRWPRRSRSGSTGA
ncbi:GntR family transcriptional regulator [Streptomyces chattanoogensis]|uniref:GntR family transcriptional regulator n=1 Tax=Streptomyces chattanoogensis TaxID=66876 RepID=UPI0007C68458